MGQQRQNSVDFASLTTKQAISIKLATTVSHSFFYVTLTLKMFVWLDHLVTFNCFQAEECLKNEKCFTSYFCTVTLSLLLNISQTEDLLLLFPKLLRSSLVNSRTQAIVCDDLGMIDYVIYSNVGSDKFDMKTKQKADLLECKAL